MADIQIGRKSTEINSKIPKVIRSSIFLFYTLPIKIQTIVFKIIRKLNAKNNVE